jgi:hypothetical protein
VVGEHLALSLVYDLPTSMRTIGQEDLDNWQVTLFEALEAARDNLLQIGSQAILYCGQGVYVSATGDNYDASRMVLLDRVRQLEVRGRHIAMIPNRDTLIVTGADQIEGLAAMAAIAEQALKQPRPIGGLAFELDDDEWVPWLPPAGHPQFAAFKRLQLQTLGEDCNGQKSLLDALHQKQGQDLFVASYSAIQNEQTGELFSFCMWAEGVESLLPETDLIFFFRPDDGKEGKLAARAAWQHVQDCVGDLLEPQGMYPERHRVREFPSQRQLDELARSPALE